MIYCARTRSQLLSGVSRGGLVEPNDENAEGATILARVTLGGYDREANVETNIIINITAGDRSLFVVI
jgi:hypothetical protein